MTNWVYNLLDKQTSHRMWSLFVTNIFVNFLVNLFDMLTSKKKNPVNFSLCPISLLAKLIRFLPPLFFFHNYSSNLQRNLEERQKKGNNYVKHNHCVSTIERIYIYTYLIYTHIHILYKHPDELSTCNTLNKLRKKHKLVFSQKIKVKKKRAFDI